MRPPKAKAIRKPIYPSKAQERWQEGYIALKLDVLKDGSVTNVRLIDEVPEGVFDESVLRVVQQWTYEPATENGIPVDWFDFELRVIFKLKGLSADIGAQETYIKKFKTAVEAYEAGDLKLARERIDDLQKNHVSNLYEFARTQWFLAEIEIREQDYEAALSALTRVTCQGTDFFDSRDLPDALKDLLMLELVLNRYADALETFDRLESVKPLPKDDELRKYIEQIQEIIASEEPFAIPAKITNRVWIHRPLRHKFTVTDLTGRIDHIDIACERHRGVIPFQPNVNWTIPKSWADCTLRFVGNAGTTFQLVELQEETTAKTPLGNSALPLVPKIRAKSRFADDTTASEVDTPIWPTPAGAE